MPKVTFITHEGEKTTVEGREGWTVLEIAQQFDVDIEGVCGGGMACSTCHVYVKPEFLKKLQPICEEEEAILEYAPDRKDNSRLGCQITVTQDLDGIEVQLPEVIENLF